MLIVPSLIRCGKKFRFLRSDLEHALLSLLARRDEATYRREESRVRARICQPTSAQDVLLQVAAYIPSTYVGVGAHCRTAANAQDSSIVRLAFEVEKNRDPRVGFDVQRRQGSIHGAEVNLSVSAHEVERVDVGSPVARESRNARNHR